MKLINLLRSALLLAIAILVAACGTNESAQLETQAAATAPAATANPADEPSATTEAIETDSADGTQPELAGVTVTDIFQVTHTQDDVTYATSPPVGGDHNPGWQNCGFYSIAVPDEQAVHSLEHGAVWVTYTASTDPADVAALEGLAAEHTHLLVTLYEGEQDSPLVATAWGRQAPLTSSFDPMLAAFIDTYIFDGPTAPEPGATCNGAYGIPPTDAFTVGTITTGSN